MNKPLWGLLVAALAIGGQGQALAVGSDKDCTVPMVEVDNTTSKKELRICIHENEVVYVFGEAGKGIPEVDITVPKNKTSFDWGIKQQTVEVTNGGNHYRFDYIPEANKVNAKLTVKASNGKTSTYAFNRLYTISIGPHLLDAGIQMK